MHSQVTTTEAMLRAGALATSAAELAELAQHHREARALIAEHPAAYDGLLDWLGALGDPAVDAALARRRGPGPLPPPPPALDAGAWREPNRVTALTWGPYTLRYLLGIALLVAGGSSLVASFLRLNDQWGSDKVDPLFALTGYALFIAGWAVLPAPVSARVKAGAIATVALWATANTIASGRFIGLDATIRNFGLAGSVFGSGLVGPVVSALALAAVLAAWLLLRRRPGLTYVLVIPVVVIAIPLAIWSYNVSGLPMAAPFNFAVFGLVNALHGPQLAFLLVQLFGWLVFLVGPAWIARAWAASLARRRSRATTPAAGDGVERSDRTNAFAIVSLCTVFVGSVLGIVFGHLALAQIARTGEGGRGLAVAALVIGYVGIGLAVLVLIVQFVLLGSLGFFG